MVFRCELKKVVDDTYDIEIGHGLQKQLIDDLKGGLTGKKRFAVITDSIVEGLYAADILGMLRDAGFAAGPTSLRNVNSDKKPSISNSPRRKLIVT